MQPRTVGLYNCTLRFQSQLPIDEDTEILYYASVCPYSLGTSLVLPEHLNVKAVTEACKLIDASVECPARYADWNSGIKSESTIYK